MDAPLDLYRASREELIALVLRQREQIAELEREQARLRAELAAQQAALAAVAGAGRGPAGPPGAARRRGRGRAADDDAGAQAGRRGARPPRSARPRKRRAHGYGRRRMRPTAHQVHAYARCPHCATALTGGTIRRTREVIEVAAGAGRRHRARLRGAALPALPGALAAGTGAGRAVVGQGRLGVGLLSLIATLARGVAPADRAHPVVPGDGAWAAPERGGHRRRRCATVAARARAARGRHRRGDPGQPGGACRRDRLAGGRANGYVWTFSTATERLFVRGCAGTRRAGGGHRRRTTPGCWSATSMPPTPATRGATSTAGRTCCATSTSWSTSTRPTRRCAAGRTASMPCIGGPRRMPPTPTATRRAPPPAAGLRSGAGGAVRAVSWA